MRLRSQASLSSFSASRGIGLELVRHLLADEANVVLATCRDPAKAKLLQEVVKPALGRGHIVPLDVDKDESIDACTKEVTKVLEGKGLNYLLNNAGIVVRITHLLHVVC